MPDLAPVVMPEREELSQLVLELHADGSPWVPSGLGNHLHWGAALQADAGMVLSMARCNRVIHHAVADFTVTVEAGLGLAELQEVLAAQDQWLPLDPPLAGPSSIGGLVARGLSGRLRHRYRDLRDQLLGISLLRSDGTAAKAGGKVVKNVAGYDLMRLFCGSWGSLGLISELTLRTMPLPKGRQIVQLKGALEDLQQLRQQLLLHSSMALEFIEWRQGPGAATCLQLGLCNLAQEQQLQLQLTPNIQLEKLPQPTTSTTTSTTVEAGQWLLRLGLEPVKIVEFMQDPVSQGWQLQLGAASGLGLAQAAFEGMAPYRVEALRRACERRSGYLTVLQSPNNSKLDAWADVKAKPLIEAVKKQFDPLNQLCRGRLPGVASC